MDVDAPSLPEAAPDTVDLVPLPRPNEHAAALSTDSSHLVHEAHRSSVATKAALNKAPSHQLELAISINNHQAPPLSCLHHRHIIFWCFGNSSSRTSLYPERDLVKQYQHAPVSATKAAAAAPFGDAKSHGHPALDFGGDGDAQLGLETTWHASWNRVELSVFAGACKLYNKVGVR